MDNDDKSKIQQNQNSALYCCVCLSSTEKLESKNIVALRVVDPKDNKTVAICQDCLGDLNRKFYTETKTRINFNKKTSKIKNTLSEEQVTPSFIYGQLDKYVMGQSEAKKRLSLAVATHLKRIDDPSIEKSNVLLLGPTGTGKTELARAISKITSLPLTIVDATIFTAHGYVGEDVELILHQLLLQSDNKIEVAETGIVFIDEIDKLASRGEMSGSINTLAVQQGLLKMIEGGKVKVPKTGSKKESSDFVYMDTSKILFICSGAFPDLEEIIKKDSGQKTIGLNQKSSELDNSRIFEKVTHDQLKNFGIIPELLGRLPVIAQTHGLDEGTLIKILTEPKNSLTEQYQKLLASYGVSLSYSEDFLISVAKEALSLKTGARALRSIMEEKLSEALFKGPDLPEPKVIIARAEKIEYNPKKKTSKVKAAEVFQAEIQELIEEKRKTIK